MADNQNQVQVHCQLLQPNQLRAIANEALILVGYLINPILAPVQLAVVYPPFEQPNFYLRPNFINLFQNHQNIRFYRKPMKNPH